MYHIRSNVLKYECSMFANFLIEELSWKKIWMNASTLTAARPLVCQTKIFAASFDYRMYKLYTFNIQQTKVLSAFAHHILQILTIIFCNCRHLWRHPCSPWLPSPSQRWSQPVTATFPRPCHESVPYLQSWLHQNNLRAFAILAKLQDAVMHRHIVWLNFFKCVAFT